MTNADHIATLRSTAQAVATRFCADYPNAVITSSRRDRQTQAKDMAENVVINREWIGKTYSSSEVSIGCQAWVDLHPEAVTLEDIASGLYGVLAQFSDNDLHHLTWHLTGDAFDVEPVLDDTGDAMQAALQSAVNDHIAAGGQGKFMTREGGLIRWHIQLSPEPERSV